MSTRPGKDKRGEKDAMWWCGVVCSIHPSIYARGRARAPPGPGARGPPPPRPRAPGRWAGGRRTCLLAWEGMG